MNMYKLDEEEEVWGSLQPEGGKLKRPTIHETAQTNHSLWEIQCISYQTCVFSRNSYTNYSIPSKDSCETLQLVSVSCHVPMWSFSAWKINLGVVSDVRDPGLTCSSAVRNTSYFSAFLLLSFLLLGYSNFKNLCILKEEEKNFV